MADIRKRQPIHEETDQQVNDENLKVAKCSDCKFYFKILPNEQKLEEEDLRKIIDDKKNSSNLYPDLTEEIKFRCQSCKGADNYIYVELETIEKYQRHLIWLVPALFSIALVLFLNKAWQNSIPKAKPFPVNVHDQNYKDFQLDDKCLKLEENFYKNQNEEIWPIILSGIKAITRNQPNQPAVFLMLYSDRSAGKVARCLAKSLSEIATEYISILRSRPVELNGNELDNSYFIEDRGRVLEKYKELIRENGVMIVTDLQDVPTEVAKSFHFMTDKFSPLVEKAVYFFTLYVDSIPPDYRQWSKTAQQTLKTLWKDMDNHILAPLVGRMTQEPMAISSSDSIHC